MGGHTTDSTDFVEKVILEHEANWCAPSLSAGEHVEAFVSINGQDEGIL